MSQALSVTLEPWIAPQPPLELVCTLSNYADILGHRLVCRRTFDGLPMDYHLAIDRRASRKLDLLFEARPFRRLRLDRRDRVAISYAGIAEPTEGAIYLLLTRGKSRLKRRLRVAPFVMMELAWVAALTSHDPEMARPVIEA